HGLEDCERRLAVTVKRAYRFALAPSPAQERMLRSHAGAARFAWNWGLARCKERYAAERKWYSAAELHKLWNAEKKASPDLAWWAENSKCAYQEAFRNLERALGDFVKSRKGLRKGRKVSKSNATSPKGTPGTAAPSGSTWGSRRCWPASTIRAGWSLCRGRGRCGRRSAGCAAPPACTRASSRARPGGAAPLGGWGACTPGLPASARTRCTRPPPRSRRG